MKINREQLVELLTKKTGLQQKQVEEQLSELINRIQEAADEGKSFEIEKFGIFRLEDEELQFEPADELETEINNKYAGMEPIEMIGAYEESDEDEDLINKDADSEEKSIWGWDGDEDEEEEIPSEAESKPNADIPEEPVAATGTEGEDHEEPEEVIPSPGQVPEPKAEKTEPSKASPHTSQSKSSVGPARPRRKSSASGMMIAASIIIVLGVALGLAYSLGVFSDTPSTSGVSETAQAGAAVNQREASASQSEEQQPIVPDQETSGTESAAASELESENQVAEKEGEENQATEGEPTYGLKGELTEEANDGYTIVVHSMQNRQSAQEVRNNFNRQDYRTIMVSALVNGETFWRIGLGQFETIDHAEQAAGRLPAPYNNDFFIKRIR